MKAKTATQPTGYLRREQAARYLGIGLRTLGELQRRRVIPFSRMGPRCVLFKLSDLDAAVAQWRVDSIGGAL